MARLGVLALGLSAVAITACDGTSVVRDSEQIKGARQRGSSIQGVDCSAAITNRVDPKWRSKSVVVGSFGLYGDATDVATAVRWDDSTFWTKIPVVVDGHRSATLRVVSEDRHRVGLTYAASASSPATSHDGRRGLATAPRAMRFTPCRDRSPTAWPGGLVLATRRPVTFEVRLDGERWRTLSIPGRG